MFIIGIAGPTASGKSALAHNLLKELDAEHACVISADNYYKSLDSIPLINGKWNFDHPDSLDHDLLASHLRSLLCGDFVDMPIYIHAEHARSDQKTRIGGYKIIIVEGMLIFTHEALRELMDIKIYVENPLDVCLERKITRDVTTRGRNMESVLDNYEQIVRPMFLKFVEPSKKYANLIVPQGGKNKIAIEIIKARFQEMLNEIK